MEFTSLCYSTDYRLFVATNSGIVLKFVLHHQAKNAYDYQPSFYGSQAMSHCGTHGPIIVPCIGGAAPVRSCACHVIITMVMISVWDYLVISCSCGN